MPMSIISRASSVYIQYKHNVLVTIEVFLVNEHMYLMYLSVIRPLRVISNNCWLCPTLKQLTTTVNTTAQTVTSPTRTHCKHKSPGRRLVYTRRPNVSGSLTRSWYFWHYRSNDWTHRLRLCRCFPHVRISGKSSKLWNNIEEQEVTKNVI